MCSRIASAALAGVLTSLASSAFGVGVANDPRQARKPSVAAPGGQADDSHSLRSGVVTDISPNGRSVEIHGHWHLIDAERTLFFRSGQMVRADALRKGQTLKFTLVAGPRLPATLRGVYVP